MVRLILKITATVFTIASVLSLILYFTPIPDERLQAPEQMKVVRNYTKEEAAQKQEQLMAAHGRNKNLPEGFELAALQALSHYPELNDVSIDFVVRKTPIPLASRPDLWSLLIGKEKRYCVIISSGSLESMEYLLMKNLTFDAQVGILGHELAHTVYYLDKSFVQVLKMGAAYPFPGFRAEFERRTDIRAIHKGLGWQLIAYANFVRYHPESTYTENNWIDKYYLTAGEIMQEMQEIPAYALPTDGSPL